MDWKDIKSLISSAYARFASQQDLRAAVSYAIESVVGLKVPASSIDIRNRVALVHAHPALKNELFLRKESILKMIASQGFADKLTDLR